MVGKVATVRANQNIAAGEELTICYTYGRDVEPVHDRGRHKYLEFKEFTCHCPRCDAPGDDTRKFDCCEPQVQRRDVGMSAYQPSSSVWLI